MIKILSENNNFLFHNSSVIHDEVFVYVLYDDFKIVYIGSTNNLKGRLLAHKKDKQFDSYLLIRCDVWDAFLLEQDMILTLLPKYNLQYNHYNEQEIIKKRNYYRDLYNEVKDSPLKQVDLISLGLTEQFVRELELPKKEFHRNIPLQLKKTKFGLPYEL